MTLNDFYPFESYLNEKMTLNDSAAPLQLPLQMQRNPVQNRLNNGGF